MNRKPVIYMQTDPRWKSKPYRVKGENATIGGSGCGPSCAAMLIETITGKTFTPEDACKWSVEHGYKALNQGTYYGYFAPQFEEFGINCGMLSWVNSYGNAEHPNHDTALRLLKEGYYIIALMGKGLWTSSGHFVVVWWQDGKVHINDPASKKLSRTLANPKTFRSQAKYYWWIDARNFNSEDEDMDQATFNKMADAWIDSKKKAKPSAWSAEDRKWAEENKLINGDTSGNRMYKAFLTREELVAVLHSFFKLLKKTFGKG